MTQNKPDTMIEAHEWECKTCAYLLRQEIGPLCCEGGECNTCHQMVSYHGIKNVLHSQLGVTKTK